MTVNFYAVRFQSVKIHLSQIKNQDYHILMRTLTNCLVYEKSDAAKFRLKVLNHLYQFGWKAASSGFNVPKSTLYDWKKQLRNLPEKIDISGTSQHPAQTYPVNVG